MFTESAEAVIVRVAPTCAMATAKSPALARVTMPSPVGVAARAILSGIGERPIKVEIYDK
jgi:hypothetical protein